MAVAMVLLAVQIFIWPTTLDDTAFTWLTVVMVPQMIGFFLLVFGVARFAALVANGRSLVYGPRVRALCALAGAVLWAQFDLALVKAFTIEGPPYPGMPFWFACVLAELYSAYRAACDDRSRST